MPHFNNLLTFITAGAIVASLLSCDGIYDDPSEMPVDDEENAFSLVDCTSYTNWVYFNLDDGTTQTLDYQADEGEIEAGWTFAMHRYDCKTNGGGAYETDFSTLDELTEALANGSFSLPSANDYTADVADSVTVDMSHMMEGYLVYAKSMVNEVLGRWLDVDTSNMPPNYTQSNKVYLIRTSGGEVAAISFTGYSNPYEYNTNGYISFEYIFPVTTD